MVQPVHMAPHHEWRVARIERARLWISETPVCLVCYVRTQNLFCGFSMKFSCPCKSMECAYLPHPRRQQMISSGLSLVASSSQREGSSSCSGPKQTTHTTQSSDRHRRNTLWLGLLILSSRRPPSMRLPLRSERKRVRARREGSCACEVEHSARLIWSEWISGLWERCAASACRDTRVTSSGRAHTTQNQVRPRFLPP